MLVVHFKDLIPVASNHDPIENVVVFRLLTTATLDKTEEGKMPFINRAILLPGKSFSPHHHGDEQIPVDPKIGMSEFFIIVSGEGDFIGGDDMVHVTDWDLIYSPRGEIHILKNSSDTKPIDYICFGVSTGGSTFLT